MGSLTLGVTTYFALCVFSASTGIQSVRTAPSYTSWYGIQARGQFYIDPTSGRIFLIALTHNNVANNGAGGFGIASASPAFYIQLLEYASGLTSVNATSSLTLVSFTNPYGTGTSTYWTNYSSGDNNAAGINGLGALRITTFRGMHCIWLESSFLNSYTGTSTSSVVLFSVISPQIVNSSGVYGNFNGQSVHVIAGAPLALSAYNNSHVLGIPYDGTYYGCSWFYTNGPRVFWAISNYNSRKIQYQTGAYTLTNTRGGSTGRLTLLG